MLPVRESAYSFGSSDKGTFKPCDAAPRPSHPRVPWRLVTVLMRPSGEIPHDAHANRVLEVVSPPLEPRQTQKASLPRYPDMFGETAPPQLFLLDLDLYTTNPAQLEPKKGWLLHCQPRMFEGLPLDEVGDSPSRGVWGMARYPVRLAYPIALLYRRPHPSPAGG